MCETFNGAAIEYRSRLIIIMLEDIKKYVMTMIAMKKEYVRKCRCDCGPTIITNRDVID